LNDSPLSIHLPWLTVYKSSHQPLNFWLHHHAKSELLKSFLVLILLFREKKSAKKIYKSSI